MEPKFKDLPNSDEIPLSSDDDFESLERAGEIESKIKRGEHKRSQT
jgi:hypothetical protein